MSSTTHDEGEHTFEGESGRINVDFEGEHPEYNFVEGEQNENQPNISDNRIEIFHDTTDNVSIVGSENDKHLKMHH